VFFFRAPHTHAFADAAHGTEPGDAEDAAPAADTLAVRFDGRPTSDDEHEFEKARFIGGPGIR
jgi:hypothetical protein